MKYIPKNITAISSVFIDDSLAGRGYLFSYRNSKNEIMNVYEDKITIIREGRAADIILDRADLVGVDASKSNMSDNVITILHDSEYTRVGIDTFTGEVSNLDIFPLYRYLRRMINTR